MFFEAVAREFHKLRESLWDCASQGALLVWQETKNPRQISELGRDTSTAVLITAFCSLHSVDFKFVCLLFILKMHMWGEKKIYLKEAGGDLTLGTDRALRLYGIGLVSFFVSRK